MRGRDLFLLPCPSCPSCPSCAALLSHLVPLVSLLPRLSLVQRNEHLRTQNERLMRDKLAAEQGRQRAERRLSQGGGGAGGGMLGPDELQAAIEAMQSTEEVCSGRAGGREGGREALKHAPPHRCSNGCLNGYHRFTCAYASMTHICSAYVFAAPATASCCIWTPYPCSSSYWTPYPCSSMVVFPRFV